MNLFPFPARIPVLLFSFVPVNTYFRVVGGFTACEGRVRELHTQIKIFSGHQASPVTSQGQELSEPRVTSEKKKTRGAEENNKKLTNMDG